MFGYLDGMADYSRSEARNGFSKLVRRAEAGEVVAITRRGKRLVRIEAIPKVVDPKP